jgi:hypothetical protein
MSTDVDSGTATYTDKRRTWCIVIDTPLDADPVITVHRTVYREFSNGEKLTINPDVVVTRTLSQIANKTVQGVSGAQLAGMIAAIADVWDREDIAAKTKAQSNAPAQPATARRAKRRKK